MCLVFQGTGNFCKYFIHSNLEYYAWSIPTFLNTFFTTVNRSLLTSEKNRQQNQKTHTEFLLLVKGPTVYCQQIDRLLSPTAPAVALRILRYKNQETPKHLGKSILHREPMKYRIANPKPDQQKIQSMLSCISRAILEGILSLFWSWYCGSIFLFPELLPKPIIG